MAPLVRWLSVAAALAALSLFVTSASASNPVETQRLQEIATLKRVTAKIIVSSRPATLVAIVNPSKLAISNTIANLVSILQKDSRPNLTMIAIYEQMSVDDGSPFDRQIFSSKSPRAAPRPGLPVGIPATCRGTDVQRSTCEKKELSAYTDLMASLLQWRVQATSHVRLWAKGLIAKLNTPEVRYKSEGGANTRWNLSAALLNAGEILKAEPSPTRCIVMLGGLAVLRPPKSLPLQLLGDLTMVAAGWRGTDLIQQEWKNALRPVGSDIHFLPSQVTSLSVTEYVQGCLT